MNEHFYKDKFFDEMSGRFERMEKEMQCLRKDVSQIKGHVMYIYAFAAGVGFIFSLVWAWLKDKIWN